MIVPNMSNFWPQYLKVSNVLTMADVLYKTSLLFCVVCFKNSMICQAYPRMIHPRNGPLPFPTRFGTAPSSPWRLDARSFPKQPGGTLLQLENLESWKVSKEKMARNTHGSYMYIYIYTSIFQGVLFWSKGWCMVTLYHPFRTLWKIQVYIIYLYIYMCVCVCPCFCLVLFTYLHLICGYL